MEQASASIVAFAAGILATIYLPALPDSGSVTVLFLVALTSLRYRRIALVGCFVLGLCWHSHYGRQLLATEIPDSWQQGRFQLEGVVRNLPRRSINVDGSVTFNFEFDVERAISGGRQLQFVEPLVVRLSWRDAVTIAANQRWHLTTTLQRPRGNANPGSFDYRAWLLSRGVGATGVVLADNSNTLLGSGNSYLTALRQWYREQFEQRFSGEPGLALLAALAVGDKQQLSPEQRRVLALTGTSHLMVISGLHIGLCALLGYWLSYMLASLRPLWVQCGRAQQFASAGALLLASAYAGLAGFSVPTTRALLMVFVVLAARQLGRETSALRILLLALLVVLLYQPLAVIEAGFWLSFGAVAILAMPSEHASLGGNKLLASLRLQLRLLIGMSPLMALLLGQFSLLAPVVNLVAIPLLGTTMVPLLLAAMLVLPLSDAGGGMLLELAMQLLHFYWQCLSAIAQFSPSWLPGSLFATGPALALAVLAVALFLLPRGVPGRMAWPLLILPLLLPDTNHDDGLDVFVLDIGQGTSVVVQTREHVLVYDAGPAYSSGYDAGSSILLPFLRHRGIRAIDTLMLSHGDSDHSGGADSVLAGMQVRNWMAPAAIPGLGVPPVKCRAGLQWQWDGVSFEILHPADALPERSNNRSCVLMISGAKRRYLLAGDIERTVERELVSRHGPGLKTDVLLIPHHGSRSSSSYDFSWFTQPEIAVASVGYRNHFGHPAAEVEERYRSLAAVVLNTAETGALHFSDSGGYKAYRWFYTRYWRHYPCSLAGETKRSWLLGGTGSGSLNLPGCDVSVASAVEAAFLW